MLRRCVESARRICLGRSRIASRLFDDGVEGVLTQRPGFLGVVSLEGKERGLGARAEHLCTAEHFGGEADEAAARGGLLSVVELVARTVRIVLAVLDGRVRLDQTIDVELVCFGRRDGDGVAICGAGNIQDEYYVVPADMTLRVRHNVLRDSG